MTNINLLHPVYKGWFWCHERKEFFRWPEFIKYHEKASETTKKSTESVQTA